METPVVTWAELLEEEDDDGHQLQEEEDTSSIVTRTLELLHEALDISQSSCDARERSSGEHYQAVTHTGQGRQEHKGWGAIIA